MPSTHGSSARSKRAFVMFAGFVGLGSLSFGVSGLSPLFHFNMIYYDTLSLYIYIHMDECLYVSCTYRCVQFPGWERWALIPIDPTLIHGFGKGVENPPCVDHFPGVVVCEPIGTMMHHHGKTPGQLSVPVVWLRCRMVKLGDAQSLLQGESDYSKSFTCWQFKCSLLKTTMFNR